MKRALTALLMLTMVLIGVGVSPAKATEQSQEVTAFLGNAQAAVFQNDTAVGSGDTIKFNEMIEIDVSFDVPVKGDYPIPPVPSEIVRQGDTATIVLAKGLQLEEPMVNLEMRTPDNVKLGSISLVNETISDGVKIVQANIIFDGDDDVFNGMYANVEGSFSATLKYEGKTAGDEDQTDTVVILGKDYTIGIPAIPLEYTFEKSGEYAQGVMTWTIIVDQKRGVSHVNLQGFEFVDDMLEAGTYVDNSFKVNGVTVSPMLTSENQSLSYVFPETTGEQVITFETIVYDETNPQPQEQSAVNHADLLKGGEESPVAESSATVSYAVNWIEKTFEKTGDIYENTAKIDWKVAFNQVGATLNDVKVTDVLDSNLIFRSAYYQTGYMDEEGNLVWNATETPITPANSVYSFHTVDTPILLTIKSDVIKPDLISGSFSINNTVSIVWSGIDSLLSDEAERISIGYDVLTKSAKNVDTVNGIVEWEIDVNARTQEVDQLSTYDLLIYSDSVVNPSELVYYDAGGSPLAIDPLILGELIPSYQQKYIEGSETSADEITFEVIAVKDSEGNRVGDLLKMTGFKPVDAKQTMTYKTNMLNPKALFSENTSTRINNYAILFSGSDVVNSSRGTTRYETEVIKKDALTREAAADNNFTLDEINSSGASDRQSFNYNTQSVVFRLHVNASGVNTAILEEQLGEIVLKDTLPAGWDFVEFEEGVPCLIYEGVSAANSSVTAIDDVADSVSGLSFESNEGVAQFSFENGSLQRPYVILLQAKPSESLAESYVSSGQENVATNTIDVFVESSGDISVGSDSSHVSIKSDLLDKQGLVSEEEGRITWIATYNPNELPLFDAPVYLEDTLSNGIDVPTDSKNNLIMENFSMYEMQLNADGSLTQVGSNLADATTISYDSATRKLRLTVPQNEKAYQYTYMTDITAQSGEQVSNEIALKGQSVTSVDDTVSYTVSAAAASASMNRNIWFSVEKTDRETNEAIPDTEFTLFTTEEDNSTAGEQFRTATTDESGKVYFVGVPEGTYILKETGTADGYQPYVKEHAVTVSKEESITLDASPIVDNNIPIEGIKIADSVGSLKVTKTLGGAYVNTEEAFVFEVTFGDSANAAYLYKHSNGEEEGSLVCDASGKATFSLKGEEWIEIYNLPASISYSLEEQDYSADKYLATYTGDQEGVIAENETIGVEVNNRTYVEISATYVQDDTEGSCQPSSVPVQLLRDGEPYGDLVLLTPENNWTYTWTPLDDGYSWTVEVESSEGGMLYTVSGTSPHFTITGTCKEPAVELDKEPTVELNSGVEVNQVSNSSGAVLSQVESSGQIPKTGDKSVVYLWLAIGLGAALVAWISSRNHLVGK